jgi:hypothetical protein
VQTLVILLQYFSCQNSALKGDAHSSLRKKETIMLIRLGSDIQFDLPLNVFFIGLVNVHPSGCRIFASLTS